MIMSNELYTAWWMPTHGNLALWLTHLIPNLPLCTVSCLLISIIEDHSRVHRPITRCTTSVTPLQIYWALFWMLLLSLGLKFSLSLKCKDENRYTLMDDCVYKATHTHFMFHGKPLQTLKFPRLYVKNPTWEPDHAHTKIKKALTNFKEATSKAF
jgi:hypothetical protein